MPNRQTYRENPPKRSPARSNCSDLLHSFCPGHGRIFGPGCQLLLTVQTAFPLRLSPVLRFWGYSPRSNGPGSVRLVASMRPHGAGSVHGKAILRHSRQRVANLYPISGSPTTGTWRREQSVFIGSEAACSVSKRRSAQTARERHWHRIARSRSLSA